MAKKKVVSKKAIYAVAIVVSIIIYLAGVYSGLNAKHIIEDTVEEDLDFLQTYVDTTSLNLKNVLLLQFFMDNINDQCKFQQLYVEQLYSQLEPYWDRLPYRLEKYEQQHDNLPPEYISLKREYLRLSLRSWLVTYTNIRNCEESKYIPLLYFYSKDCDGCVEEGEELDKFKKDMLKKEKQVMVFPVDISFKDDTLFLLKKYYNISKVPAIVHQDKVVQGKILTVPALRSIIR